MEDLVEKFKKRFIKDDENEKISVKTIVKYLDIPNDKFKDFLIKNNIDKNPEIHEYQNIKYLFGYIDINKNFRDNDSVKSGYTNKTGNIATSPKRQTEKIEAILYENEKKIDQMQKENEKSHKKIFDLMNKFIENNEKKKNEEDNLLKNPTLFENMLKNKYKDLIVEITIKKIDKNGRKRKVKIVNGEIE
jgi:hypothetical protein